MPVTGIEKRTQTVCLIILTSIAVGAAMYWLAPVLVPFVLAVFFTYCLTPVIDFLQSHLKIPRALALVISVVIGIVILLFLGGVILTTVNQISDNMNEYLSLFKLMLKKIIDSLPLDTLRISRRDIYDSLYKVPQLAIGGILPAIVDATMSILSNGTLVIIFMIFIMIGRTPGEEDGGTIFTEIESRVKRYVITKVLVSTVTAAFVYLTLKLLNVDFALVFGVLAFFLNFIPNVGSAIATLLPLPIVLISVELSVTAKIMAIFIPGAIQFVLGNLVEPRLIGETLDLHPITILLSLIFFGMLWGIPGMFLATPITAVIKIILERSDTGIIIAEMLAGRLDRIEKLKANPVDSTNK